MRVVDAEVVEEVVEVGGVEVVEGVARRRLLLHRRYVGMSVVKLGGRLRQLVAPWFELMSLSRIRYRCWHGYHSLSHMDCSINC
jgi:hypothetical protein